MQDNNFQPNVFIQSILKGHLATAFVFTLKDAYTNEYIIQEFVSKDPALAIRTPRMDKRQDVPEEAIAFMILVSSMNTFILTLYFN